MCLAMLGFIKGDISSGLDSRGASVVVEGIATSTGEAEKGSMVRGIFQLGGAMGARGKSNNRAAKDT